MTENDIQTLAEKYNVSVYPVNFLAYRFVFKVVGKKKQREAFIREVEELIPIFYKCWFVHSRFKLLADFRSLIVKRKHKLKEG